MNAARRKLIAELSAKLDDLKTQIEAVPVAPRDDSVSLDPFRVLNAANPFHAAKIITVLKQLTTVYRDAVNAHRGVPGRHPHHTAAENALLAFCLEHFK